MRLTTGRRLESFSAGVQTGGYGSPLHRDAPTAIRLAPADGERYGVAAGALVRVVTRRGSVQTPVRFDDTLRPGPALINLHFPDQPEANILTIYSHAPNSGTAEST